jgi:hypothetical protein
MAIFGSNTDMPTYVNVSGTWQELTGTDRPYANVSGTWQGATNMYAKVSGTWQQVYLYDSTAPVVPKPTVVSGGSSDTVSWTAVTDAGSGVASATLNQGLYNVTTNTYTNNYQSVSIGTGGASSTTMSIPSAIRNTPTGNVYMVYYWISATDNVGLTTDGDDTPATTGDFNYTKPLGTYNFFPTGADSRNLADTAWLGTTVEGRVGLSSTARAYGCWFYGSNTIYDKCLTWEANSGTIFVKRARGTVPIPPDSGPADPNRGQSGTWTLQGHNLGSASGAATFSGTGVSTGGMNTDSFSVTVSLNSSILAGFASGSMQGIGGSAHTNQPAFLLGNRDFSGFIQLVYT